MKAPLIDPAQWTRVWAHLPTMRRPAHYTLLALLVRDLGLRPIELARLDRSWFRGGELRIPHGRSKRGRARSLPVSPAIMDALAHHMGDRQGRVFLNRTGEPFTAGTIGDSIKRMFREAGVDACCYSGRRTLATNLVDRGVNLIVIRDILGHQNVATTQEYVGSTDAMMRRALFAA